MRKYLLIVVMAAVMSIAIVSYVYAQTATPTMTPSPISVPGGAPSTGHGSL